jgi:hypothetical protein
MAPYQKLYGHVPNLAILFVLGCRAEAYIDEPKERPLGDDRSKLGLFVGYDKCSRYSKFLPTGKRKRITVRLLGAIYWRGSPKW